MHRLAKSSSFCDDRAADLEFLMSFDEDGDPAAKVADRVVSSLTMPRRGQVRDKIVQRHGKLKRSFTQYQSGYIAEFDEGASIIDTAGRRQPTQVVVPIGRTSTLS